MKELTELERKYFEFVQQNPGLESTQIGIALEKCEISPDSTPAEKSRLRKNIGDRASKMLIRLGKRGLVLRFFSKNRWYDASHAPGITYLINAFLQSNPNSDALVVVGFLQKYRGVISEKTAEQPRRVYQFLNLLRDEGIVVCKYNRKLRYVGWSTGSKNIRIGLRNPQWDEAFVNAAVTKNIPFSRRFAANTTQAHVDEIMRFLEDNPGVTTSDVGCLHATLVGGDTKPDQQYKWAFRILRDLREEGLVLSYDQNNHVVADDIGDELDPESPVALCWSLNPNPDHHVLIGSPLEFLGGASVDPPEVISKVKKQESTNPRVPQKESFCEETVDFVLQIPVMTEAAFVILCREEGLDPKHLLLDVIKSYVKARRAAQIFSQPGGDDSKNS